MRSGLLEQNRRDLAAKEKKFQRRHSFTYTVVSPDEGKVLGCVYVNKGIGGPDAAVFMWVRGSEREAGLDSRLDAAVREWMESDWPLERVVYPGRPGPQPAAEQPDEDSSLADSSVGREDPLPTERHDRLYSSDDDMAWRTASDFTIQFV